MYDNVMKRFQWGNMNKPGVYVDETNSRMVMNMRGMFGRLAEALILEGKTDSARQVLDRCFEVLPETAVPYDYFTVGLVEAYYKSGQAEKANVIAGKMLTGLSSELRYYFSFADRDLKDLDLTLQESVYTIQRLSVVLKESGQVKQADEADALFQKYYNLYVQKVYEPAAR
jgi:hypothetical protein